MSKISKAFANGKAFIPFITCGDPDLETTREIVRKMVQSGADLIELGIPFSDPTAEGPVIMDADLRALNSGTTTEKVFQFVEEIRKETDIPMVFMTYANVLFSYGSEEFIRRTAEVGIDGIIIPDIPYEEKHEFSDFCAKYNVDFISMIAPTSENRIAMIAREATGFLYCVSSLGVTGTRTNITTDIGAMVRIAKSVSDIPCAVGFGISTPEQAEKMASQADGVIVGSAIVKLCAKYGKDAPDYVAEYVKEMKEAAMKAN